MMNRKQGMDVENAANNQPKKELLKLKTNTEYQFDLSRRDAVRQKLQAKKTADSHRAESRLNLKFDFFEAMKLSEVFEVSDLMDYRDKMNVKLTLEDWSTLLTELGYLVPPYLTKGHLLLLKTGSKKLFPQRQIRATELPKAFLKSMLEYILQKSQHMKAILTYCTPKYTKEYLAVLANSMITLESDRGDEKLGFVDVCGTIFLENPETTETQLYDSLVLLMRDKRLEFTLFEP